MKIKNVSAYMLIGCILTASLCNLIAKEKYQKNLGLTVAQASQFARDVKEFIAAKQACFNIAKALHETSGHNFVDLSKNADALYKEFDSYGIKLNKFISNTAKITDLQNISDSLIKAYNAGIQLGNNRTSWLYENNSNTFDNPMLEKSKEELKISQPTLDAFKKNYGHIIDQFQK